MSRSLRVCLILLLSWLILPAWAENATRVAGYAIHHNALLTSDLDPQMASRYQIRRSPNRAMITISIIREKPGTVGEAVMARVKVTARNLRGQVRQIPLREVVEGNAVYYLGEFLVENGEVVDFDIEAVPQGTDKPLHASFEQQFITR